MRRSNRRGETQKGAVAIRNFLRGVAAGGKQLDLALFQAEVRGRCVGKEFVTRSNDAVVQLMQIVFILRFVRGSMAVHQWPAPGPIDPPLQRPHHTIGIAGGKARLP